MATWNVRCLLRMMLSSRPDEFFGDFFTLALIAPFLSLLAYASGAGETRWGRSRVFPVGMRLFSLDSFSLLSFSFFPRNEHYFSRHL